MDILSMDIHSNAEIFVSCADSVKKFLDRRAVIVWGIVPTGFEAYEKENLEFLCFRLENIWKSLGKKGIDIDQIIAGSMLSPATCCLVNQDKTATVEKAFSMVNNLAEILKEKYHVY